MQPNGTPADASTAYNEQPTLNASVQQLSAIQAQGLNPSLPQDILSGPSTFGGGTRVTEGQLPNNIGYGQLFYDPTGVSRMMIGFTTDGEPIILQTKTGTEVVDVLS